MTRVNQTRQDAFLRVVQAQTGSLAGQPTTEYLEALEERLRVWIEHVREEWAKAMYPI